MLYYIIIYNTHQHHHLVPCNLVLKDNNNNTPVHIIFILYCSRWRHFTTLIIPTLPLSFLYLLFFFVVVFLILFYPSVIHWYLYIFVCVCMWNTWEHQNPKQTSSPSSPIYFFCIFFISFSPNSCTHTNTCDIKNCFIYNITSI